MTLSLHQHDWVELGYFVHRSYHHSSSIPSIFGVNATNPFQCHRYVKENLLREFTNPAYVSSIAIPSRFILSWPPPWTLYHQIVFTSTKSFASFHVVDVGFIKALLRWVTSCRHQLIMEEVDLGTTILVLWSLHASMASFSLSATGLHQWPSTEIFYVVFNINSCIHTTWIVLQYLEGHHHYRWFLSRLLTAYIIGW